jgi:glycosyltransferase involved in cell wall biosynthesis
MNIALLHYAAPPVVGGVESVIAHHARQMANAGHHVKIIAARGEQTDPRIPFVQLPLADSRHEIITEMKAALDRGKIPTQFYEIRDALIEQLDDALRDVDVLIAHNVCSLNKNLALTAALHELNLNDDSHKAHELSQRNPIASVKISKRRFGSLKLVLWHHDLAWTTPRYLPELHDGYPWDLLRTVWRGAIKVVVSEIRRDELAELMKIPRDEVVVVPNGVDVSRFYKLEPQTQTLLTQTKLLDSDLILLLPVRVTPRKNIELALRVLAHLKSKTRAALVVTGPLGPHNGDNARYFEKLKHLRAELKLEDSAQFLAELCDSFLPDEVIADFYRVADALFLPSREEGFGIPMIEAAFSRLPIFCADIPPLRALGKRDATYFSPDEDPQQIASKVLQRMNDEASFRVAKRMRADYRWENIYRHHISPLLETS